MYGPLKSHETTVMAHWILLSKIGNPFPVVVNATLS